MEIKTIRQMPVEVHRGGSVVQRRAVVELAAPLKVGRKRSPFVLLSHVSATPWRDRPECLALLAEEDGCVLDWCELHAVYGLGFAESYAGMIDWLEGLEARDGD